ncbi:hypothetical protein B0F90DRAFT_1759071 [Multifurca ochricompacta]|uniref:DUF6535 domain-containing protein n=1 Tax=Multifurca ochricompacta TaxID=376703 RepID=A0AAD4LY04_9AGAM|nr:hypothetical protein B0F90DRAFT_1759071 [Multifurca ochricompacta]
MTNPSPSLPDMYAKHRSDDPKLVQRQENPGPWAKDTLSYSVPMSPDLHPIEASVSLSKEQWLRSSNTDIWSEYNSYAERYDTRLVERWKGRVDSTLAFAGLFSVVITAFMVGVDGGLRRNSPELPFAQLYLQLAGQVNVTYLPTIPPTRPTTLDVASNVLWSLSLALCLACALGAILVQEWIQEYLRYSQCHSNPSTRARIRAYLFNGLNNYRFDQVVTTIPLLLHLAILLFGAGLVTYFLTLNNILAYTTLGAYSIIGTVYFFLTISPLIHLPSPFKSPVTVLLRCSLQLIQLSVLHIIRYPVSLVSPRTAFSRFRLPKVISACRERYRGGMIGALEQDLESAHPKMDAHSLRWALLSTADNTALESLITAIPGFLDSEPHRYPQYTIGHLLEDREVRLGWSIGRLLQTCESSSSSLEPHVRKGRAIACMRAVWCLTEKFAGTSSLYWDTLFGAETAEALSILKNDNDPCIALIAQCTTALAARSCLRELANVAAWTQGKGPYWTSRARHLASFIGKLVEVSLPEKHESVARDGPLLNLASFLCAASRYVADADAVISFMVITTVKHLADGVRAGEASLDAQQLFVFEAFAPGTYDRLRGLLDPAAFRAVRFTVVNLHQELVTRVPMDLIAVDADVDQLAFQE